MPQPALPTADGAPPSSKAATPTPAAAVEEEAAERLLGLMLPGGDGNSQPDTNLASGDAAHEGELLPSGDLFGLSALQLVGWRHRGAAGC